MSRQIIWFNLYYLAKKLQKKIPMSKFKANNLLYKRARAGQGEEQGSSEIFTNDQLKISVIHGRRTNFDRRRLKKSNLPSILSLGRHEKLWPFFPSWKHSEESLTCFSDTNHCFFSISEKPRNSIKILHSKEK